MSVERARRLAALAADARTPEHEANATGRALARLIVAEPSMLEAPIVRAYVEPPVVRPRLARHQAIYEAELRRRTEQANA